MAIYSESAMRLLLLLFYFIPIVAVIQFITTFAVNVPSYDQWVLPGLFEKVATYHLTFADLFELHNYHRILFPRLIFIALGFLSSWNILAEIGFSFLLASITYIFLYQLSRRTTRFPNQKLFHLANLITCILIFSLTQRWLWGFQLPIFLINLVVILGCLILRVPQISNLRKLSLTAICCLIASFSSAQGLISWLAMIPGIISLEGYQTQKIKRISLWFFLFLLSAGIYSIGYDQDPKSIELTLLEQFLVAIQFFFNLLAAPLISSPKICFILGIFIFINFILLYSYFFKEHYLKLKTFGLASPWISIGLFSLMTSILMATGRVEQGADYPIYAIRYTTHTLLLFVAIVQLWRIWIEEKQDKTRINSSFYYSFIAGILVCLVGVRSGEMITETRGDYLNLKNNETCLQLINYLEDSAFFNASPERCVLRMSKTTWWIRDGVESLQKIQLRQFAEKLTFQTNPEAVYGYIDSPQNQDEVIQLDPNDTLILSGWAILPDEKIQPNLVFLSLGDRQSFFANAEVNLPSPDIAQTYNHPDYHRRRWNVILSTDSLPSKPTPITAWVYHSQQQQFLQLRGKVQVFVKPAEN